MGLTPRQGLLEPATSGRKRAGRDHEQADKDPSRTDRDGAGRAEGSRRLSDGIQISILRDGDSWEFRAAADKATEGKPGYPESVAMLVQIGDHLSKQYDVA